MTPPHAPHASSPRTTVEALTTVGDDHATVTVTRVETPKGERLGIQTSDETHQVRLDAVLLECLASQPAATFREFLDGDADGDFLDADADEPTGVPLVGDPGNNTEPLTTIKNEFAHAEVGETGAADRLCIFAPKRAAETSLSPTALEGLTYQSSDVLTELVRRYMEGDD